MAQGFTVSTALVTGAGQGLGKAIAERMAEDGIRLVVHDITQSERLEGVRETCSATAVTGDLSVPATAGRVVEDAVDALGGLDALVVNHAAMAMAPFLEHDLRAWWHQIDVNLRAAFLLSQSAVRVMRTSGGGRIVFIASEVGVIGMRNGTGYAASKGGLIALAKSMAREMAMENIVTNAVAPSYMDTSQLQVDADDAGLSLEMMKERLSHAIPVGRLAAPSEVAAVVSYLLGPYGGAMVGQVLQPNGGTTRARG